MKRKLRANVSGREVELEVRETAQGALELLAEDGTWIPVDQVRSSDGAWSLLVGGRSWEAWVSEEEGPARAVMIRGRILSVELEDLRRHQPEAAGIAQDGWVAVKAPMPGRVVEILVAEGEEVQEGQGLVVVEAMKMENEFHSPKAGIIVQIPVEKGQSVEAGQLLAAVE